MSHPPVLRKPGEGQTVAVVGDVYRFLATGDKLLAVAPSYGTEIRLPQN